MSDAQTKSPDSAQAPEEQDAAQAWQNNVSAQDKPEAQAASTAEEHKATSEAEEARPEQTAEPAREEPREQAPELAGAGRFNACFNALAKIGPLALLAALLCMAWPIFWEPAKGVYCPAELKSLTAFLHCVADGSWLAPTGLANGEWTLAQWPVFTWAIGLLALSPSLVESGYLLPATSFLCTFAAVLGAWCLAHAAGFGYRAAFAAGLILLCAPVFAPLPHFMGPASLAAALFLFALVFFCRGWRPRAAWISLPLAFVLTALAGLCGGWLFLATPLIASFCYLAWRGELRRAHKADAIFGYILMILILGGWLAAIMLNHVNDSYLPLLFAASWQWAWPIPLKWLLPLAAGIIGAVPWILMIFGVNWARVLSKAGKTLSASRNENGSALVWLSLMIALPIAIFTPWFHPAAIAILCLVAVLLGKASINLGPDGSRFFCLLASILTMAAGCALLCLGFGIGSDFFLPHLADLPIAPISAKLDTLPTLRIIGGIVLLGGIIGLMFVKRFSGCGPLIYGILLTIIICQPARLSLLHELAALPETPLDAYADVIEKVDSALAKPTPAAPALAAPEPATPAAPETQPDAAPIEPAAPAEPEEPAYVIPPAPGSITPAPEQAPAEAQPAPNAPNVPDAANEADAAVPPAVQEMIREAPAQEEASSEPAPAPQQAQ